MKKNDKRQFYFSLPRFIATLCGGDAKRSESNALEAWLVGLSIYFIHCFFFAKLLIPSHLEPWLRALLLAALVLWIWLFWLLLLYLNFVIIKLLRACGLFRTIPTRRAQSILWGISTTAMVYALLNGSPALHVLGVIWLAGVAMNLAAAAILSFRDAAFRVEE